MNFMVSVEAALQALHGRRISNEWDFLEGDGYNAFIQIGLIRLTCTSSTCCFLEFRPCCLQARRNQSSWALPVSLLNEQQAPADPAAAATPLPAFLTLEIPMECVSSYP